MGMQHGYGHASCTWICGMGMDMHDHASMLIQIGAAKTRTCSVDMDVQHPYGHTA
jgi:hypothetical protein